MKRYFVWPILSFLLCLLYSGFSLAVVTVVIVTIAGMALELLATDGRKRWYLGKAFVIVYAVYLLSAVIFSSAFENGKWFLGGDPMSYFELLGIKSNDMDPLLNLISCYGLLSDGNELHELFVRYCILFANNYLDGANILYLTLNNVCFGILVMAPVYRVLCGLIPEQLAYKYTVLFALCSPFLTYSCLFVRDIVAAFFYAHAIEIILGNFKVRNLLILTSMVFVVWGIRLYTGLFMISFVAYYLMAPFLKQTRKKTFIIIASALLVVAVLPQMKSIEVYDQAVNEVEGYQEFSNDRGGASSLSSKLSSLPVGISQVALVLYTQIAPFPNFYLLGDAKELSHFYMALQFVVFELYWYFVAFGLLYMLFVRRAYRWLTFCDFYLLAITFVFLLLNAAHPDVRRFMGIYPLILYFYVKVRYVFLENKGVKKMNKSLGFLYVSLLLFYFIIK